MGKTPRKTRQAIEALTEVELEMMTIIWRIGACSVAQILASLPPERPLAYTSVSTIVRILEQKGFVSSEKEGRGHRYDAVVAKVEYQARSLNHLISGVFDGAPSLLVRRLLADAGLTKDDLAEIKKIIENRGP